VGGDWSCIFNKYYPSVFIANYKVDLRIIVPNQVPTGLIIFQDPFLGFHYYFQKEIFLLHKWGFREFLYSRESSFKAINDIPRR